MPIIEVLIMEVRLYPFQGVGKINVPGAPVAPMLKAEGNLRAKKERKQNNTP